MITESLLPDSPLRFSAIILVSSKIIFAETEMSFSSLAETVPLCIFILISGTGKCLTLARGNSFNLKYFQMNFMAEDNKNCIFCKILHGQAPSETIYESNDVLCIKDIHPASTHHYLIIPKVHIENAKVLKPEDEHVLEKMLDAVKLVSERHGLDPASTRTGFHWPPFTTTEYVQSRFQS
ncbi:histidine triad nucleotide-binding protein 3 isoform X2 [Cephus cinctus]|uniref:Histidine triad nucleotide-binding protein 3 isoform X2 n=1 Tax=Cephus cinctus TaxID=211228 RepID=A0AAJ7BKY6_CEPCN|nr:histidine triad nucleotide-binding protein 3 isoform X2 [Cephus cinctus]